MTHLAATIVSLMFRLVLCAGGDDEAPNQTSVRLTDTELSGWKKKGDWKSVGKIQMDPAQHRKLAAEPGTGVIYNGTKGSTINLISTEEFADVEAHIEFMVPEKSNSGVYFMSRYEIQILDSWGVENLKSSDCGSVYERWKDDRGYEGKPPRINASRKPGEWQTFDVVFRAPRFDANGKKISNAIFEKVLHNGKLVHQNVEVTGPTRASTFEDEKPTGPLMLQGDHGPVAFRNIRINKRNAGN